jgi:hypothetical protein
VNPELSSQNREEKTKIKVTLSEKRRNDHVADPQNHQQPGVSSIKHCSRTNGGKQPYKCTRSRPMPRKMPGYCDSTPTPSIQLAFKHTRSRLSSASKQANYPPSRDTGYDIRIVVNTNK